MKINFFSVFKTMYGIIFGIVLIVILFFQNVSYYCKKNFVLSNKMNLFITINVILVCFVFYYWIKNKKNILLMLCNKVKVDKIVLVGTGILFLGQCYVFYNAFFLSGWDTCMMRSFVDVIMNDGEREGINFYFSQYPNNLLISYMYLFLQKMNSYFGVFSSDYSYMCVVVLNCAINSFSCWLSYKTAQIFVSYFWALITYVICFFSIGISGWSIICYSDALALFVPILSVYLYCRKYKNARMKNVGIILAGCISVIGYFIKPQCLFVLIGILILESLKLVSNFSLDKLYYFIAICLVAIIVFSSVNIGIGFLNKKYCVQIDKEKKIGISHFLMMGANKESDGVYWAEDVIFSDSFATSKERKNANMHVFKKRIVEMKGDLIIHLRNKILVTFNDGTYAWDVEGGFFLVVSENLNSKMAPFLKSIYCDGGRYVYFETFQQLVWFFILFSSFFSVISKKGNYDEYNLSLFWIVLLGLFLYEMLFEVRARYVYIFGPLFCILVSIGIRNIYVLTYEYVPYIKNKMERIVKK